MSGVDICRQRRGGHRPPAAQGRGDAIRKHVESLGGSFPADVQTAADDVARRGSTPLVVCDGMVSGDGVLTPPRVLGVVELKDIVKGGIKERFAELRRMGIKTVMITGDNRLTAAAIAAEAGVDDFLAEATPEAKLKLIRELPGRRPAGGDDGRRHQRRPRAGPGRRGRGHEHRHAGRQGGGQHGRPGQQPDQADRDRRDRQADADDTRLAHHLQHRQRHREVLRHHPGGSSAPTRSWAR
jgi:hypothetical protein